MTWLVIALISGCTQLNTVAEEPTQGPKTRQIRRTQKFFDITDPIEVKKKIDRGEDIVIIDVREEYQYKKGHLKNAIHIPLAKIRTRLKKLDPNKETIVYCQSGFQSRTASNILVSEGFKRIRYMSGGIQGWSYDLVK